jgi:SagB-type dehydrogenase family enzyme
VSSQSSRGFEWIVSPHVSISWRNGRAEIACATTGTKIAVDNPDVIAIVHHFSKPMRVEDVVRLMSSYSVDAVTMCIDEFISEGILRPVTDEVTRSEDEWEASALAFHRASREVFVRPPPPTGSARARRDERAEAISLPRRADSTTRGFVEVLDARHSTREWSNSVMRLETLSEFLWLSARDRSLSEHSFGQSRPYPSGGGVYSLTLYAIFKENAVERLPGGVYRYNHASHALSSLKLGGEHSDPFLNCAARSSASEPPPVVLVLTSRIAEQTFRYGKLAYSLVLKEVGALFQTFYLSAEYLNLGACALGAGAPERLLATITGAPEIEEPIVGEFMIGPVIASRDEPAVVTTE